MSNIYVYDQGSKIQYKDGRLQINTQDECTKSIPIESVDNVLLFGAVNITTNCISTLLKKGIHLTWLSKNGSFFGRLESTSNVNITKQRLQFRKSDDENFRLGISKQFIKGKTKNQRTILQRYARIAKDVDISFQIKEMEREIKKIDNAATINELMGLEGNLARIYYSGLSTILPDGFKFKKRTKRPPKDPFNSLLSFGYTLLHYEIFTSVVTRGLNPYAAFLHADREKHPALCSDLMEEWRPVLIDSLAVAMIKKRQISENDFSEDKKTGGIFLTKEGCQKFAVEFEKRLKQEVSYVEKLPYRMSFRRIIDRQILELTKAMENDSPKIYESILIR